MKLLHVVPTINPATGGVAEGVRQIATANIKMGHVVEVATLDSADESWLQNLPFKVHPLGPSKLGYRYSSNLIPWLRENTSSFDAVIVDGLWQYHGYATWKVMRKMKVPYYVFTHGMLDPWFKKTYPLKHLKKWMYWPWAEYRILRDAKAVLFTCEEERILSSESFWLFKCRPKVVSYGTLAPAGDPALQREKLFKKYPILRNKRLFLYLSRIHQKKGCDLLIQAFAKVANRDKSLHLVIAGPDETGWQITSNGSVVDQGGLDAGAPYPAERSDITGYSGDSLSLNWCLPSGSYTFIIYDYYYDGVCCSYGSGSYSLTTADGTVLASGGSWSGLSEETAFTL